MISKNDAIASDFSTPLAGALSMAGMGFRVIPCNVDKSPIGRWLSKATRDPAKIRRWFEGSSPAPMYGVVADDHTLIDVDVKRDAEAWIGEYLDLGGMPPTFVVISPSGGFHRYYVGRSSGKKPSPSIDIKTGNGYCIGPGSPGYIVQDATAPAPLPSHVAARLGQPPAKTAASGPLCDPDSAAAYADAWALVARTKPLAESEGIGRNKMSHELAGRIKRLGLSQDECLSLVLHWNATCHPPQPEDDVRKAVASSYEKGDWAIGADRWEGDFEDLSADPVLLAWDRQRAGIPAGPLTEGSADIDLDEIIKWRANALVKGILHPGEQAVLYADPGAGKSFVALDLAWHVAQGAPWHGRKVARAPVLYVALEGVEGFRGRVKAIEREQGAAPWFRRQKAHVSLIRDKVGAQGLETVLAAVKETAELCGAPVGLVIVDTLARAMAGDDENSAKDVMHFVDHRAGELARQTGAAVLTLAHSNKLGTLRGSLTLSGAVNVVLKIERDSDSRTLTGEKIKDGDEVPIFDFTLRRVHLATDADGDPVASCVIDTTAPTVASPSARDTPAQKAYRQAYETVSMRLGQLDVPLADVGDEFKAGHPTGERDPDAVKEAKRQAWKHARKKVPAGLKVWERDGKEWIGPARGSDPLSEFDAIDGETVTGGESP